MTRQPPSPSIDVSNAVAPRAHHLRVQRTARYYTLGAGTGAPKAIWFVLHGYAQLAGEFIRYFADLANEDTLIVAPEALNRFYLLNPDQAAARDRPIGATWMTRDDRESEIADYVEYLDALHHDISTAHPHATVNVVGFSQGAATATRWTVNARSRIDRLVLWGGLLPPETDLARGPALLRGARLTLVLGDRDHYINGTMFSAEQLRLNAAGIAFDVLTYYGGHAIKRAVFPRLLGVSVETEAPRAG